MEKWTNNQKKTQMGTLLILALKEEEDFFQHSSLSSWGFWAPEETLPHGGRFGRQAASGGWM